jgi:hypothetical protein
VSSDLFGELTFHFPIRHVADYFSVAFNVSAFKICELFNDVNTPLVFEPPIWEKARSVVF